VNTGPPSDAPATRTPPNESERQLGLLLFEAEECLARGAADKALVLASRAVKERPDSLTARSLLERARRDLLRGRRRERLEARVAEAQELLDQGDFAAAERIVTSALKLIPDHAVALALFARLKERKLGAGTVEADAEKELQRLAQAQARKALEAARSALDAGWDSKGLLLLRRGLRQVPDDAELLHLLREAQARVAGREAERARRRASAAQVRAGLDLLQRGTFRESLQILRAVLLEDPDNPAAQAAVQDVRRAFLARADAAAAAGSAASTAATPSEADPGPAPPAEPVAAAQATTQTLPEGGVPFEILLPRTRLRATPLGWIVAGGAAVIGLLLLLTGRPGHTPAPTALPPTTATMPPFIPQEPPGPLTGIDPGLRRAIEAVLADYARALEATDATLLAAARPDLSAGERERRIAPFAGALGVTADLRVLDVAVQGDAAEVPILLAVQVLGGAQAARPPLEETLRFERRGGTWVLRARRQGGGR